MDIVLLPCLSYLVNSVGSILEVATRTENDVSSIKLEISTLAERSVRDAESYRKIEQEMSKLVDKIDRKISTVTLETGTKNHSKYDSLSPDIKSSIESAAGPMSKYVKALYDAGMGPSDCVKFLKMMISDTNKKD